MQNAYREFFCAVIYRNMSTTTIAKQFACFVLALEISSRGDAPGAGVEDGRSRD